MSWIDLLLEIVIFSAGISEIWQFIKKRKSGILSLYDKLSLVIGILYYVMGAYFLTPLSDKQDVLTVILGIVLVASVIVRCIYGKNKNKVESRQAICELNDRVETMLQMMFGISFMTGEEARHETTESLKVQSRIEEEAEKKAEQITQDIQEEYKAKSKVLEDEKEFSYEGGCAAAGLHD